MSETCGRQDNHGLRPWCWVGALGIFLCKQGLVHPMAGRQPGKPSPCTQDGANLSALLQISLRKCYEVKGKRVFSVVAIPPLRPSWLPQAAWSNSALESTSASETRNNSDRNTSVPVPTDVTWREQSFLLSPARSGVRLGILVNHSAQNASSSSRRTWGKWHRSAGCVLRK